MSKKKNNEQDFLYGVDVIDLTPYYLDKDKQQQFLDNVMTSIDKQKNQVDADEIKGLQVISIDSHSAQLNGNMRYYHPYNDKKTIDSYTTPYNKPVLRHHNSDSDAIGRITSAKYVDMPHPLVDKSIYYALTHYPSSDQRSFDAINKLKPFLFDSTFEGLGYIQTVKNIVDEDAIQKIIDGRYTSISVGFAMDAAYCSICHSNWRESRCDHWPGESYDIKDSNGKSTGKKETMFLIAGNRIAKESSFVNTPADAYAKISSMKKITIPVGKDSIDKASITSISKYYAYDNESQIYIPFETLHNIDKKSNNLNGDKMNLKELYSKSIDEVYSVLSDKVSEGKKVSNEDLAKLDDNSFLGGNKMFPVHNLDYCEALETVLGEVEDSEEKTELLDLLQYRKNLLKEDDTKTGETKDETPTPKTDEKEEQKPTDSTKPKEEEVSVIDKLKETIKTEEDAIKHIKAVLDGCDFAESVVAKLAEDKIAGYESRLKIIKHELDFRKTTETKLLSKIEELSDKAKTYYIDKILSFQKIDNPAQTKEATIDTLKTQSIDQLDSTLKNLELLLGSKEDKSIQDNATKVDNPTHSFGDSESPSGQEVTADRIAQIKTNVNNTYKMLLKSNPKQASVYLKRQNDYIKSLEDKLTESENKN